MRTDNGSFRKLMLWTSAAAVLAIVVALVYLAAEPGRLGVHQIIATIMGVGATVMLGGGLTALMYLSASSGRDDAVGGPDRKVDR